MLTSCSDVEWELVGAMAWVGSEKVLNPLMESLVSRYVHSPSCTNAITHCLSELKNPLQSQFLKLFSRHPSCSRA